MAKIKGVFCNIGFHSHSQRLPTLGPSLAPFFSTLALAIGGLPTLKFQLNMSFFTIKITKYSLMNEILALHFPHESKVHS